MADWTRWASRGGERGGVVRMASGLQLAIFESRHEVSRLVRVPVSWRPMYVWPGLPGGTCRAEEELERDIVADMALKGTWRAVDRIMAQE